MRIIWSLPVFGESLGSGRGDVVRAGALIRELRAAGHRVDVVEAAHRPGGAAEAAAYRGVVRRYTPDRVALTLRDLAWWWRSRGHGRRVARRAREEGAELLVETQVHGTVSGARAARITGLPLVLDDVSPPSEPEELGTGLAWLAQRALERQLAAAALLVSPSGAIRARLLDAGAEEQRLEVVPNGVDLRAYRDATDAPDRQEPEGGGDDQTLVVAFVGSFQRWHRVELLVRAFAELRAVCPCRLLLVGDGPRREAVLAEARRLGVHRRVVAPGSVPPTEVPGLLASCHLGVLPGTNDYGHPMKLLEYAAAGLPAVAPDLATVRGTVVPDETAILFPPGDLPGLLDALSRLASNAELRRRMGVAARERVQDAGWSARAAMFLEALERVSALR